MLWPPKGTSVCQTTCFELQMLNIFLYLWFVHETKRIVCMLVSKNWNVPYLPSQNGLTVFFCQILHYNSTPQRKDITRRLLNIFNIFSRFLFTEWSNLPYSIYCAKLKWLLTQILHYRAYAWKWNFFGNFVGRVPTHGHRLAWNFAWPISGPTCPMALPNFTWIGATSRPSGRKWWFSASEPI